MVKRWHCPLLKLRWLLTLFHLSITLRYSLIYLLNMAKPTPAYPTLLFKILWLVQGISSLIVVISFYATWANVKDSAELLKDFAEVGDAQKVTEWNAPWFFKLVYHSHYNEVRAI
jgi:hypothetical protein